MLGIGGNSLAQNNNNISLIPKPQEVIQKHGFFEINNRTVVALNGNQKDLIHQAQLLSDILRGENESLKIGRFRKREQNVIVLSIDKSLKILGEEGYSLSIDSNLVKLSALSSKGIFYGIQTIRQLSLDGAQKMPSVEIEDSPRFGWRGFMLDCSRHFWTIGELEKVINHLAQLKMNRLHLHLTDNQGWRLEIKKYPKLTSIGTHYKDFPKLSGKFYTQDQMRNLIKYAQKRNVMIVPEIDLPGHSRAVLAAYPELSCRKGEFEVYPMEQPSNKIKRGAEVMLCAGNEKTYQFVKDVIKEVAALFPSPFIHLGGDEVGKNIWKKCPHCQAKIKAVGVKDEEELQDYFTRFASRIAAKYNKRMIGWDEINDRRAASGDDVVMVWRNHGTPQAQTALKDGLNVVMCPQHGCYYDWGYSGNSTKKVYNWDPIPKGVSKKEAKLVMGAQACLWTERVATSETIEERIFPRIMALAEVVWLNADNHNWNDFLSRLQGQYPLMEKRGVNYYHEDEIDSEEFKPGKEKPALVRHAFIETNMGIFAPYYPEYVFDGRKNSYFWTSHSPAKGEWFLLKLGEKVNVNEIEVITGDSKDYLKYGILEVSEDGNNFIKVGDFKDGKVNALMDGRLIKSVRIKITKDHSSWMIIKEIIIK